MNWFALPPASPLAALPVVLRVAPLVALERVAAAALPEPETEPEIEQEIEPALEQVRA